jgi:hypothetical protein
MFWRFEAMGVQNSTSNFVLFYKGAKLMSHFYFYLWFCVFFPFVLFLAFTLMLIIFILLMLAFALIGLALALSFLVLVFTWLIFVFVLLLLFLHCYFLSLAIIFLFWHCSFFFWLLFLIFILQLHNIVQVFAPSHCCCMVLFKYLFFHVIIELSFAFLFFAFVLLLCPPFMLLKLVLFPLFLCILQVCSFLLWQLMIVFHEVNLFFHFMCVCACVCVCVF